jgi:hypothetical protein
MARSNLRFVPLLGVLFVLLVVVGFIVGGETPDIDSAGATIRGEYDNEGKHQTAAFLVAISGIPLLFFASHLRAALKDMHASGRITANVALVGATVAAAGLAVMAVIHSALAEAAQKSQVQDGALQALNALDSWSFYPLAIGLAAFMLASGLALVRGRRFLPNWVGWAAVVLGVLSLIPIVGFFAAILSLVWILVVSVMLFARWESIERLRGEGAAGAPSLT